MKVHLTALAFAIIALGSCTHERTMPLPAEPIEPSFSYFPLDDGMAWCFHSTFYENDPFYLEVNWKIAGDTVVDGKEYKKLTMYDWPFKFIREEHGNFYKRKHFSITSGNEELLFLMSDDPDGASWEQFAGNYKYSFSQTLLPEMTVKEKTWHDVIGVRTELAYRQPDGTYEPVTEPFTGEAAAALYYFAPEVGIIYMYEPSIFNQFSEFGYVVATYMVLVECE